MSGELVRCRIRKYKIKRALDTCRRGRRGVGDMDDSIMTMTPGEVTDAGGLMGWDLPVSIKFPTGRVMSPGTPEWWYNKRNRQFHRQLKLARQRGKTIRRLKGRAAVKAKAIVKK